MFYRLAHSFHVFGPASIMELDRTSLVPTVIEGRVVIQGTHERHPQSDPGRIDSGGAERA